MAAADRIKQDAQEVLKTSQRFIEQADVLIEGDKLFTAVGTLDHVQRNIELAKNALLNAMQARENDR